MLPHNRDCPASSDASKYEAHCRRTSVVGPFSKVRNLSFGGDVFAETSGEELTARELREHLGRGPAEGAVPRDEARERGRHERAALVGDPLDRADPADAGRLAVRSPGSPSQSRTATCPTKHDRAACRWPGALLSFVMTSMSPGTSGRPSGSYDGPFGSDDVPWPPSTARARWGAPTSCGASGPTRRSPRRARPR